MTRKDYELLAHALRLSKPPIVEMGELRQWYYTVRNIGNALQEDNLKFDRGIFNAACGV